MTKLTVIAVGTRMQDWVSLGWNEYARRMSEIRLSLVEVKVVKQLSVKEKLAQEASRIMQKMPKTSKMIALDERGKHISTNELASKMSQWKEDGQDYTFIIGGADGLDDQIKTQADEVWRLSSLTLPHGAVRILLAEALYRAWTITINHPYHRE